MTIPKETNIKWAKVGKVRFQGSQLTGKAEAANLQSTRNAKSEETWTIVAISSVGLIHLRKVRCPDDAEKFHPYASCRLQTTILIVIVV